MFLLLWEIAGSVCGVLHAAWLETTLQHLVFGVTLFNALLFQREPPKKFAVDRFCIFI